MGILASWAWSSALQNKTGNIGVPTHFSSYCDWILCIFIIIKLCHHCHLHLYYSVPRPTLRARFFFCLSILSHFSEMVLLLAAIALAPLFACKLHLHMFFFSSPIEISIWKSAFAVSSHWNHTHTCNIVHGSWKTPQDDPRPIKHHLQESSFSTGTIEIRIPH